MGQDKSEMECICLIKGMFRPEDFKKAEEGPRVKTFKNILCYKFKVTSNECGKLFIFSV